MQSASPEGVSNLSDILSVRVQYKLTENDSISNSSLELMIKLLPRDPFSRYFVTEAKFDLREIQFYTQILPDLLAFQEAQLKEDESPVPVSVPKCLHSHYVSGRYRVSDGHEHQHEEDLLTNSSPDPPESILVLQDMRPFGYDASNFVKGLTLTETAAALRALANVHALSLCMKSVKKLDLNERYPFLFQVNKATDSYQQLVEQGLPQLTEFLQGQKGFEDIANALRALSSKTRDLIESLLQPQEPMGLMTHTDFWCNNLLFHEEKLADQLEDSCVILDWQMVTYSRPTNDIALLMVSSLPSDIRRKSSEELLDIYYTRLKGNCLKLGVDIEGELNYSRGELGADYRCVNRRNGFCPQRINFKCYLQEITIIGIASVHRIGGRGNWKCGCRRTTFGRAAGLLCR